MNGDEPIPVDPVDPEAPPGDAPFWTPAHVQVVIAQAVGLVIALGWLTQAQGDQVQSWLSASNVAIFALVANLGAFIAFLIQQYKTHTAPPPARKKAPPLPLVFALGALALFAPSASAQCPQYYPTPRPIAQKPARPPVIEIKSEKPAQPQCPPGCDCGAGCKCGPECPCGTVVKLDLTGAFLPWRKSIEKQLDSANAANRDLQARLDRQNADQQRLLAELIAKQQAPQPVQPQVPQQIIIQAPGAPAAPPLQQLPIQGQPQQQLPIQGDPKQQLPIQGAPLQPLPIQGQPQQPLPVPGQPLQPLPIAGPIQGQPLPVAPAPVQPAPPSAPRQALPVAPPTMPPASGQAPPQVPLQSYTVRAIWPR